MTLGVVRAAGKAVAAVTAATAALGTAALCLGSATAAAEPRPVHACTATAGVLVAVDLASWGGPLLRSCGTTPTTGYALLNQGGWRTIGTDHDGPGFVCRISYSGYRGAAQYPPARQEPCVLTPPASAYWTNWYASPGQNTWTYSPLGAMSYRPAPGSVELWVFGGTNISGTSGSAVPALSPDSIRGGSAAAAPPAGTPAIVNAAPLTSHPTVRRGSPVPAVLTGVIVLMAAAGGALARRRARGARL